MYLDLAPDLKDYRTVRDRIFYWYARKNPQSFGKGCGRITNQRTSRDYPVYSIIKIDQNTEKSPGHLRNIAVTQTPMKVYQITLVWETLKGEIISINKIKNLKSFADLFILKRLLFSRLTNNNIYIYIYIYEE